MSNLFISYRRDDSADVTGRIYDRLVARFGSDVIFRDVDTIPLGVDFLTHLNDAVGRCAVLLAIIGRQWLHITDTAGQRRLDDARDFVRIEIEAALQRGIPIIPVLTQGTAMPAEAQLPASLGKLAFRNGLAIRSDPDFHRDVDRLILHLDRLLTQAPSLVKPASSLALPSGLEEERFPGKVLTLPIPATLPDPYPGKVIALRWKAVLEQPNPNK